MRAPLVALAAAALLAGCSAPEEAAAPAPPTAAPAADSALPVATPVAVGGPPPAFAADYPGATMQDAIGVAQPGRRGGMRSFTTRDAPDKVLAFYKAKAAAAGLSGLPETTDPRGTTILSLGGEAGDLVVGVMPERGQTGVMLTWSAPAN